MKILFSSKSSFNLYNYRLPLLRYLKSKGYTVILVGLEDSTTEFLKNEFIFFPLKSLKVNSLNPLNAFSYLRELINIYRKVRPNIVINITIKAHINSSFACQFLNIPYVSLITGLGSAFSNKKTKILSTILYKLSQRKAKKVIFQNPCDMEYFISKNIIKKTQASLIRGSGIDTEHFNLKYFKAIVSKKDKNKKIFLFLGRLIKEKGIQELVEAGKLLYQKYKNFEIHILGFIDYDNPNFIDRETFKKIKTYPFIKYLGSSLDVRPYIAYADCVVLPTYYNEGLPRSLLEAMSMERIIITTNICACKDLVIEGKNGYFVKPKDIKSLYLKMEKVLNLPQKKIENMGKFARKFVKDNFSLEKILPLYEKEIMESLDEKNI